MKPQSDQITFEELKRGSKVAFETVYLNNRTKFIHFARRFDVREADILDIYQDAYVVLYENISNGKLTELRSSISTYLTSIGKYKIHEYLRKNKKKNDLRLLNKKIPMVDEQVITFDVVEETASAEQLLLQKHFKALSEKCREILTWFYYKRMSIAEIQQQGNYNSLNVVKSQKSRCLKTLKTAIKTEMQHG